MTCLIQKDVKMLGKRTHEKYDCDLALVKKIFLGLPKLFNPKFRAVIEDGTYSCCVQKNICYTVWSDIGPLFSMQNDDINSMLQKAYHNNHIDFAFNSVIAFNDLDDFPKSFKKDMLSLFFNKILRNIAKNSIFHCNMLNDNYISFRFASLEELLVKIDMNANE